MPAMTALAVSRRQVLNLAVKIIADHFRGVSVLSGLILPLARLKPATDKQPVAFLEILLDESDLAACYLDGSPEGAFLLVPIPVFPCIGASERQVHDLVTILECADFRVFSKIADAAPFIECVCHLALLNR